MTASAEFYEIGEVPGDNAPGVKERDMEERKREQEEAMEWRKQYEERRRLNRGTKLGLTKNYHSCGIHCNHGSSVTSKPTGRSLPTRPDNPKKT